MRPYEQALWQQWEGKTLFFFTAMNLQQNQAQELAG